MLFFKSLRYRGFHSTPLHLLSLLHPLRHSFKLISSTHPYLYKLSVVLINGDISYIFEG